PVSGPHSVKTPAPRGRPIRFIAFGDSGNGSNTQANLGAVMTAQKPDFLIHVGDLVYSAGEAEDYPFNFYEPYAALIRSVPFMASLGNHDVVTDRGGPLLNEFVLPENGPAGIERERNYYFDFGDARFVALDTNQVIEGGAITAEQMKTIVAPWLHEVLTDCDARWKFAYFHHPFYTGSDHFAEGQAYVKDAFVAVLEECGVDLVFCGHNHLYERTWPIREDRIVGDGEGVVYITTGAGGVNVYPETDPPPAYMRAFNDEAFSFTRVDLKGDVLELKQINDSGGIVDEYTVRKSGVGDRGPGIRG
ncbi:MAG: metallophosphoesterase family protein, partial [Phycisphaerae bacterium]